MNRAIWISLTICFALSAAYAKADLVDFTDDFANTAGSPGTVQPTGWNIDSANTTFVLESGDTDDADLLDAAGDGYASLSGNTTANGGSFNTMVSKDFGVVMAADVGNTINLQMSYLEVAVGGNMILGVARNGSFVSSQAVGTFSTAPNSGMVDVSYIVDAGDVGQTLSAKFQFFTSQDARVMGLDTVASSISAVPEPASCSILSVVGLTLLLRRKRT